MKKPIKGVLAFVFMLLLLIFGTGCTKYSSEEAIELIEDHLNENFRGTFKVVAIDSKTSDGNGVPFASVRYYIATVTEVNSGFYFEANCNGKTGAVTDYYRQSILAKDLDMRLKVILDNYPGMELSYPLKSVNWGAAFANWKPADCNDLIDTGAEIQADLFMSVAKPAEMADEIFRLIQELEAEDIILKSLLVYNKYGGQSDVTMLISSSQNTAVNEADIRSTLEELSSSENDET